MSSHPSRCSSSLHRPALLLLAALALAGLAAACADPPVAPGNPDDLAFQVLGGDQQSGPPGAELPLPLIIRATTATGVPLPGIVVNFHVTSGGGTVYAGAALTDHQGRASDYWTLGPDPGPQALEVRVVRSRGVKEVLARFSATAVSTSGWQGLAAGSFHTCALAGNGQASCWGDNVAGDLGDGTTTSRLTPTPVLGGVTFATLSGGYWHSCGLAADGRGYCWGFNAFGDLGDGTTTERHTPTPVAGGYLFTELESATWGGCGLVSGGTAYCWGNNDYGRLGNGGIIGSTVPVAVAGGLQFTTLVAGDNHTCALASGGQAWCWGLNNAGQLGDGTLTDRHLPTLVAGGRHFTRLALGYAFTCGLADGSTYCWGDNRYGNLGDGTLSDRLVPTPLAGSPGFVALATGGDHACGLLPSGAAMCWGRNSDKPGYGGGGQLGDGSTTDRYVPTPVSGGLGFTTLSLGESHSCGITGAGAAWCWGNNAQGQLGDGTTTNRLVPTPVQ